MLHRKFIISILLTFVLLSLVLISCTAPDNDASPSEFYEGKTVNIVICGDPGSIADLISRVIADRLSTDTQAKVIFENRSEAGGLDGMNYLSEANPDGLTLGTNSMNKILTAKIFKDPAAHYELDDFSYILNVNKSKTYFFISSDSHYQSIDDLQAGVGLKIAAGSASGSISLAGLTIVDLLDLDAKVITGFENNTARSLATQRGEVIGYATKLTGLTGGELEAGTLKPLFVLGTTRDPDRPDIPAITELTSLSKDDLALVELWESGLSSGTVLAAPVGISKEKYLYLCDLAEGWCQDDSFYQDLSNVSGYYNKSNLTGQQLKEAIYDMASKMEEFQFRFADMIDKYRM
jgi:tripartite-type tricarboxylate transporter receptor subunit TctC